MKPIDAVQVYLDELQLRQYDSEFNMRLHTMLENEEIAIVAIDDDGMPFIKVLVSVS